MKVKETFRKEASGQVVMGSDGWCEGRRLAGRLMDREGEGRDAVGQVHYS